MSSKLADGLSSVESDEMEKQRKRRINNARNVLSICYLRFGGFEVTVLKLKVCVHMHVGGSKTEHVL